MFDRVVNEPITSWTPADQRDKQIAELGGRIIGQSEAGRDILGIVLGRGAKSVSLIAGNHSDEPVGSETLRLLATWLAKSESTLKDRYTFVIIPHTNPDGEAAQQAWLNGWPDPLAMWQHAMREKPGRDVEFGYPDMRPENRAAADFLAAHGPYAMHLSLHGMAMADGGWHLIERSWGERTALFRAGYARAMRDAGLSLFDWDRQGEKGFEYIEPGFATTPRSDAMQAFFQQEGDADTAAKFHLSSMEFIRSLGGDPLCMVTELPLFVVEANRPMATEPGRPVVYLAFREALANATTKPAALPNGFVLEPMAIATAVTLQLRAIELGLKQLK